jgi:hypothetical protein
MRLLSIEKRELKSKENKMKHNSSGVGVLIIAIIFISGMFLGGAFSCSPRAPAEMVVEVEPLTVMPHPKFGFELVIVPAGTSIDGFVTTEPGLYLSGNALQHVIQRLGIEPKQWTKRKG